MSDIVERLRLKRSDAPLGQQHYTLDEVVEIMAEAADEIERLRAAVSAAKEEGRRDGLEEAAKRCEAIAESVAKMRSADVTLGEFDIAADGVAAAIRSLSTQDKTS